MNARVRPQYRYYVPRRRGFRGLGDDGTDDSSGDFTPIGPPAITANPVTYNPAGLVGTWYDPTTDTIVGKDAGGNIWDTETGLPSTSSYRPPTSTASTSTGVSTSTSSTPAGPTSPTQNWAAVLNTAVANAGKIIQQDTNPIFNLAPGTYAQVGPGGTIVSTAGIPATNPLATLTSSSMMPLLLIGGAGLLLFAFLGKK
jgi:hypothetical protein